MENQVQAQPFLKWVGGKRALLPQILPFIDEAEMLKKKQTYYEPFLGAGAVLFSVDNRIKKIGNDFNAQLIQTYIAVRDNPNKVISELELHKNVEQHYYKIRNLDREKGFESLSSELKAARFIFLNRTCFNGLYRVNSDGYFNVPFGKYKSPNFVNKDLILSASEFLNSKPKVKLTVGDYRKVTIKASKGDLIYFDPPYDPSSETSNFTSYSKNGFTKLDQAELRDEAVRLTKIGARILLSNSDTEFIRDLFKNKKMFKIHEVEIHRGIAAKAESRRKVNELIISNFS